MARRKVASADAEHFIPVEPNIGTGLHLEHLQPQCEGKYAICSRLQEDESWATATQVNKKETVQNDE